jgi:hypothetical protein
MTTSVVFDEIDYAQIEYDINSTDDIMLTDPSASIIALQGLRVLKTRATGDDIVTPVTNGRTENTIMNYSEINYEQYRMRRKAEVLKYPQNLYKNKKTEFSALVSSRRGKITNFDTTSVACTTDIIRVKKASNSGIKCDNSLLFYDKNVAFIEKL